MKKPDGPIQRVRRVRHEISERYGHDPRRLLEHYIQLQEAHKERLLETVAPENTEQDSKTA